MRWIVFSWRNSIDHRRTSAVRTRMNNDFGTAGNFRPGEESIEMIGVRVDLFFTIRLITFDNRSPMDCRPNVYLDRWFTFNVAEKIVFADWTWHFFDGRDRISNFAFLFFNEKKRRKKNFLFTWEIELFSLLSTFDQKTSSMSFQSWRLFS